MRPGIIGGGRGPIAADRQEFVAPESNASPCCDLGVIWVQDAVAKRFPLDFSSDSSSMLISEGSFLTSFTFNECSEFVGTVVLLFVGSGESKFCSSIPC